MGQIMCDLVTAAEQREDDRFDKDYENSEAEKNRRGGSDNIVIGDQLVFRNRWQLTVIRWEILCDIKRLFSWSAYGVRY